MTDKQIIIDEERMFECVWCKYDFKESEAHFILSENPNECVCSDCMTEWADNLLCDFKRKEQECEELLKFNNSLVEEHKTIGNDLYKEIKDYRIKLKAKEQECERLKEEIRLIHDDCKGCDTCFNALESARIYCVENQNLKQTLTEIKELLLKTPTDSPIHCVNAKSVILQKISECEGNDE